jgi:hypothetical protein
MPDFDFAIAGRPVHNQFQLLGEDEDDITVAIAWALTRSPVFFENLLRRAGGRYDKRTRVQLLVHRFEASAGITDVEIIIPGQFHMILEAKRGWILPKAPQLKKYAHRQSFVASKAAVKKIVTLSECSNEYARAHLPFGQINGVSVQHISWANVIADAVDATRECGHIEKRVLGELVSYLRIVMTQQDRYSNLVYVVSLGGSIKGWSTSFIDVVTKYNRYFHPLGGSGWPKVPPTYLGFRYHGQLQSIHFVKEYEVVEDLAVACPKEPATPVKLHYLYTLGPPIVPAKKVVNGTVYPSGRVWCAIDALLTCDSVSEARDVTKARGLRT